MHLSSFVAFLLLALVATANAYWLIERLRTRHEGTWQSLGRPSLAQSNVGSPRLALLKWVWSLRFRHLADRQLILACWSALVLELLLALAFVHFCFL